MGVADISLGKMSRAITAVIAPDINVFVFYACVELHVHNSRIFQCNSQVIGVV